MDKIPDDAIFRRNISQLKPSVSELIGWISDFLHKSKSKIKQLLREGAIEINGEKFLEGNTIKHHDVLRIGKKLFFCVEIPYYFEHWETNDNDYFIYRTRSSEEEQ